ncbi:MAG: magnesium transporter [Eubacteriales bacterium]
MTSLTPAAITEMLETKQIPALRQALREHTAVDVAELFEGLDAIYAPRLFRLLSKEVAAAVFTEMDTEVQQQLIHGFTDKELTVVLEEMYVDDTVDLIEEMPANVVKRILANSTPQSRAEINELLQYPPDSAGGMMTTEYVRLRQNMTVTDAFTTIRRVALDKETVYTCYVTDDNRRLLGVVDVKSLLLSPPDNILSGIMNEHVVCANTLDDKEAVAKMFERYGFMALPVVDKENRLVGIVTFDDAMDVLHEEAEEDFAKMAAITPTETPYLRSPVGMLWKSRIPWLLLLMVSATFTGMIIASFEQALAASVVLTAFIPMLMGTGGNSGSQASVTVVRALSIEEIKPADVWAVLWKEVRVSLLCGVTLGAVNAIKMLTLDRWIIGAAITLPVVLSVSLTLLLTVLAAKVIGCTLPLLAQKLHLDPAVMASPLITTVVDAVSLLTYFMIASALLGL